MNKQVVRYDITLKIRAYRLPHTVQEPTADRAHKPQPRRPEPPRAHGDLTYTQFWAEIRGYLPGMKASEIRQALEVDSMKDWVAQGRTLYKAIEVLLAMRNGRTLRELLVHVPPHSPPLSS